MYFFSEINECASSPCKQGTCIDEINDYQCICDTAYFGRQCSNCEYTENSNESIH